MWLPLSAPLVEMEQTDLSKIWGCHDTPPAPTALLCLDGTVKFFTKQGPCTSFESSLCCLNRRQDISAPSWIGLDSVVKKLAYFTLLYSHNSSFPSSVFRQGKLCSTTADICKQQVETVCSQSLTHPRSVQDKGFEAKVYKKLIDFQILKLQYKLSVYYPYSI